MTGQAMRQLLDHVGDALDEMGPFERPEEEADAHRHLLRLCSAAIDLFVERADPARPLPTVWMSPTRKFLGDSPDTIYTTIPVSSKHRYTLTIEPGNALYIGVLVYARSEPGGPVHTVSSVVDETMTSTDGRFVIDVGPEVDPDDAQGLHLDDQSFWIMVRQYFANPAGRQAALITIERTDGMTADAPPDPAELTAGMEAAGNWIRSQARADVAIDGLMAFPAGSSAEPGPPPVVPDDLISLFFPTPDISYQGCRIAPEPDQRLEVAFTPPACRFWSVVLSTPWLESVEQRSTPASINSTSAQIGDDGTVRIVVAERDPGVANWIPLRGYHRAQVAYRVLLAESEPAAASFVVEQT